MNFWAHPPVPKWMIGLSVLLVVASGLAAAYGWRNTDFAWEQCQGPRLDEVTMVTDFEVATWPEGQIVAVNAADIDFPVAMAVNPVDGSQYVTTLGGVVFRISARGAAEPVLDIADEILVGDEQGLLGIAIAPDGEFAYVTFTDSEGTLLLVEYQMPELAVRRQVLAVPQPQRWHNGGSLEFGPDGFLYVGLGDGGTIGDQYGNGQSLDSMLGTIIRIDPRPHGQAAYGIPADNPFLDGPVPETFVYGLRNPWTFAFDEPTGDLWIGDVGQNCVEEIDVVPAATSGQNFGWAAVEGNMRFRGDVPPNHVPPVFAYERGQLDCSVIWGGRYQGSVIPELKGRLLFVDYCRGKVMALGIEDGAIVDVVDTGVQVPMTVGFGFDGEGEVYLLTQDDGIVALVPG